MKLKNAGLFLIMILFMLAESACSSCDGKNIRFVLHSGRKGDHYRVFVNDHLKTELLLKEDVDLSLLKPSKALFRVCASMEDSLKVRFVANKWDTTFFVHPKEIKEVYVGVNIIGELWVFCNYERGGLRENDPNVR